MRSNSPAAVRGGLIGVFAVLVVALVGPTVSAQFRPGMPNVPRPNFQPIPQPNFPNIPRPNIPNIPRPNIPAMPGMGGPQFPDIPRPGGLGGLGGFGMPENIYYCKKCNTELGRGMFPPATATCQCGLTYNNGVAFDNGRNRPPAGGPAMPFNPNPVQPPQPVNLPQANVPNLEPVFADNVENPQPPVEQVTPGTPGAVAPPAVPPKTSNRTLYIIGGVVLALLVLLGMILGVMYVQASAKKHRPVRRRIVRDDYDD